jgi:pimeloyl-ACP methyl ester carboxylesterase
MAQRTPIASEKFRFTDGSEVVKGIRLANYDPDTRPQNPLVAVFGNGAFGSVRTFGPIIRGYLRAAARADQPAQAVTYFDPWFGSGTYTAAYRAERLSRVTLHAARAQPVHLVGHSWSWPGAVAVADASPDSLRTLAGYTPVGHRGTTPVLGRLGMLTTSLREATQTSPSVPAETLLAMGALAGTGLARIVGSHALREANGSFVPELTSEVIQIHKRGLPVGMLLAEQDAFFGVPEDTRDQLIGAGIDIRELATTHGGAVTQPQYGAELYRLTEDLAMISP